MLELATKRNYVQFSEQVFAEILADIASCTLGVRQVLESKPYYPSVQTFYTWMNSEKLDGEKDSKTSDNLSVSSSSNDSSNSNGEKEKYLSRLERYAIALSSRTAILESEVLEIADNPKIGYVLKQTPKGIVTIRADMLEHRRLQVETRKWLLAKLAPKRYGERVVHQGDADAEPIQLVVRHIGVSE